MRGYTMSWYTVIDMVLHVDRYLTSIIAEYGTLTYAILFLIIFCETGLVVMPFLPGDSLLFASGAFAAQGAFHPGILIVTLIVAAILGDTVNYALGRHLGQRVFREDMKFINKKHLAHAQEFYAKHGAKTIVLARFVPIVRTFAPFLAGVSMMNYRTFLRYNVIGGVAWISIFVLTRYLFGNLPLVKNNFGLATIAIIIISLLPIAYEYLKHRQERK